MFLIFLLVVGMQCQVSLSPMFLFMAPQLLCPGVFLYGQLSMSVGILDHFLEQLVIPVSNLCGMFMEALSSKVVDLLHWKFLFQSVADLLGIRFL